MSDEQDQLRGANGETLEIILDYAAKEMYGQGQSFEQFDRKTGVILGFALISIGQVVSILFRLSSEDAVISTSHPTVVRSLLFAGLFLVVLGTFAALLELLPRTFYEFSVLEEIENVDKNPNELRVSLLKGLDEDIKKNDKAIAYKSTLSKITILSISLAFACYLIVGTLLLSPLLHNPQKTAAPNSNSVRK